MQGLSAAIKVLARALAIAGGTVLAAITVMTAMSIIGRTLISFGLGPVPGDFELVEAGAGFAVFAFLPWCQLNRGHATVDLFTNFLSPGANRVIDLVTEILMSLVIILIAWRLVLGTADKYRYGETTFILQFPVWWGYAVCVVAAVVGVIISLYMTAVRVREVATGRSHFAPSHGVTL
jgi:TRAP-type C4-dicarboxylate transport system permease small subunit